MGANPYQTLAVVHQPLTGPSAGSSVHFDVTGNIRGLPNPLYGPQLQLLDFADMAEKYPEDEKESDSRVLPL